MGTYINIGNEGFVSARNGEYVDKSSLKKDQSAHTAIEQIHHKQYQSKVSQYDGQVILVGINYDSKTKKHECKIETV